MSTQGPGWLEYDEPIPYTLTGKAVDLLDREPVRLGQAIDNWLTSHLHAGPEAEVDSRPPLICSNELVEGVANGRIPDPEKEAGS